MHSLLTRSFVPLLVIISVGALAEEDKPLTRDDFAFGASLGSADSSLRKFYPGVEILKDLVRPYAGDLRVFDNNDMVVPALVRRTSSEETEVEETLEFYPLFKSSTDSTQTSTVQVIRNDQNEIEKLISNVENLSLEQKISGYLIDKTAKEENKSRHLSALKLAWKEEAYPDLLKVSVEHSDDLNNWRSIYDSFTISNLLFEGKRLKQNLIEIPSHTDRFIRINFIYNIDAPTLDAVTATYKQVNSREEEWLSLGSLLEDSDEQDSYRFTIPSGVRPSKLRFVFSSTDVLVSGRLYCLTKKKKWKLRYNDFSQYRVSFGEGDEVSESSPVRIPANCGPEWKFVSDADNSIGYSELPEVEIAYPAYEVVFVSQGVAPYQVAWGNARAKKQSTNMRKLIRKAAKDNRKIEVVEIGATESIRGLQALTQEDADWWKRWVLWLVLLTGVLVVARLAYQLFKEMNTSE